MTTVSKIRKLFASGRPRTRDQQISPITAYGQAGELFERLQQAMTFGELDPRDADAFLVVNELADVEYPVAMMIQISRDSIETSIPKLLAFKKPVPVGAVFRVQDRQEERPEHLYKMWASPFLGDAAAIETLRKVLDKISEGGKTGECAVN